MKDLHTFFDKQMTKHVRMNILIPYRERIYIRMYITHKIQHFLGNDENDFVCVYSIILCN